jgi:S-adenosylmethionine hydrolase
VKNPVIALMTDFGEDDFFVASLKGVILKINPSVWIIDITHRIPSFDIQTTGFILLASYKYFPSQTIFLVVVDPGVGSERKILMAKTKEYYFIAPDNGVLSLVLEEEEIEGLREVTNEKYFLPDLSQTFEGRDKMAPAAAWVSKGISYSEFGPAKASFEKLDVEKPQIKGTEIVGHVLYQDKFGNLVTDIPARMLEDIGGKTDKEGVDLVIRGKKISSFIQSYSSAKRGELLFLVGSVGTIEIAAREESASKKLKAGIGDEVRVCVKRQKKNLHG